MGADETKPNTETKDHDNKPPPAQSTSTHPIEVEANIKPAFARNVSGGNKNESSQPPQRKKKRRQRRSDPERKRTKKANKYNNRDINRVRKKEKREKEAEKQTGKETDQESLRAMFKQKYTQRPQTQPQYKAPNRPRPKYTQTKAKAKTKAAPLALMPIYSTDDGDTYDKTLSTSDNNRQSNNEYLANPLRMINDHSQNIWNQVFDGDCSNDYVHCIATQRILRSLKWYSNVHGDGDKIWKKIKDRKYGTNLISDYHHFVHSHLNKGDTEKINICKEYNVDIECDEAICEGYKRKHGTMNRRNHVPFYVSCLDTIHCVFAH